MPVEVRPHTGAMPVEVRPHAGGTRSRWSRWNLGRIRRVKISMQTLNVVAREQWLPVRQEALRRMAGFLPRAGRTYAAQRNYDRGPALHANVSTLSPYIRHRALTETELLEAVLAQFSRSSADKFVQEIFWRTYWKGWLQSHPAAWSRYQQSLAEQIEQLDAVPERRAAYERAVNGQTGIAAFDVWARELSAENYLHNHARMWFASIWIFTLGLPWELGADFFLRHLLDGDPASNTLSWRWVAGLHTRGRAYAATGGNIERYTDSRFRPETLARAVKPLEDEPLPLIMPPALPPAALTDTPSLLVLHDDDLHADLRELPIGSIRGVCALPSVTARSPLPISPAVIAFTDALLGEAVARAAQYASGLDLGVLSAAAEPAQRTLALRRAAEACGASRIIAPFAPVGPARAALDAIQANNAESGPTRASHAGLSTDPVQTGLFTDPARAGLSAGPVIGYAEFSRRYDAASWPSATRGFFNLRAAIPTILTELGIGAG